MKAKPSPTAIGGFVIGALALTLAAVIFFAKGDAFRQTEPFVLFFDGSIQGLRVGAPVALKGVQIGEVTDIKVNVHTDLSEIFTEVYIEIDPARIGRLGVTSDAEGMSKLILKGMRAQLKTQSLLTGLLYIEVDVHPKSELKLRPIATEIPQFPTIPSDIEVLTRKLENIDIEKISTSMQQLVEGLNRIANNPELGDLATNLNVTVKEVGTLAHDLDAEIDTLRSDIRPVLQNANRLLVTLNREVPPLANNTNALMRSLDRDISNSLGKIDRALEELNRTLKNTNQAMSDANYLISDDSPLLYELGQALQNINDSAYQLRTLTETLDRRPEAVLQGKRR